MNVFFAAILIVGQFVLAAAAVVAIVAFFALLLVDLFSGNRKSATVATADFGSSEVTRLSA